MEAQDCGLDDPLPIAREVKLEVEAGIILCASEGYEVGVLFREILDRLERCRYLIAIDEVDDGGLRVSEREVA